MFSVALAAGAWFLVDRQRDSLTADVQTTAELRADDLAAALEGGSLPASVAVPVEDEAFVQIVGEEGAVLRASPNIDGEPRITSVIAPPRGFGTQTIEHLPVGDTPFRVVARRSNADGVELTIYVGASLEPVDESVHDLEVGLATGTPLLILLVAGLTWTVVGLALRPVDAIRSEVERISERELHRRVPEPTARDEIGRLARTMNRMLQRLDDSAGRQRRFVADASHELRSPLTGMRAQLEVDLAHPDRVDWQTTEGEVLDEVLRLQRLVDDLLVLARVDAPLDAARPEPVDLDDLALAEARRLVVRGKVRVDAHAVGAAQVIGDADALARVIRNLLDNAERHARNEVSIVVREHPGHIEIIVSDDGPGVPTELREQIFDRFARADDARGRGHGGAGLGLAIAREIVAAHAGTISLADTASGATFVVRLPRTGP